MCLMYFLFAGICLPSSLTPFYLFPLWSCFGNNLLGIRVMKFSGYGRGHSSSSRFLRLQPRLGIKLLGISLGKFSGDEGGFSSSNRFLQLLLRFKPSYVALVQENYLGRKGSSPFLQLQPRVGTMLLGNCVGIFFGVRSRGGQGCPSDASCASNFSGTSILLYKCIDLCMH